MSASQVQPLALLVFGAALACRLIFAAGSALYFVPRRRVAGLLRAWLALSPLASLLEAVLLWRATPTSPRAVVAVLLCALALALFGWAAWAQRGARPAIFDGAPPGVLVITGPYRLLRHPFYTAYLLVSLAALTAAPGPGTLALALGLSGVFVAAALQEERAFTAGPLAAAHAAYRERTGWLLPRLAGPAARGHRARAALHLLRLLPARLLRQRPGRAALCLLGIAAGVGLHVTFALLERSVAGYFAETVSAIAGKARLSVIGDEAGFPEERLAEIEAAAGVAIAVPLIEARARTLPAPGRPAEVLVVLGVDLLREAAVRGHQLADRELVEDPLSFLNQPDSIILTRQLATARGLRAGSTLELLTASGRRRFTVRGLLAGSGAARAYGGGLALMDIDAARLAFGKEGRIDRVDVVPAAGVDERALGARLEHVLGAGLRVERPEQQVEALERMVASYQAVLATFGVLALLCGLLAVANVLGLALAERRGQLGLLRALGATRPAIVLVLLGEGALLGLLGSLAGLGLGRLLAAGLLDAVARGMSAQFVTPIAPQTLALTSALGWRAVLLGSGVALLAALWPALRASRVAPLAALASEQGALPGDAARWWPRARALAGALLLLLLPAARLAGVGLRDPRWMAALAVAAIGGCFLLAPALVTGALRALRGALSLGGGRARGVLLRLSCDGLLRNPRQRGASAVALVFAVILAVIIATTHASFREGVAVWLERTLGANLVVSSQGRVVSLQVQPLDEGLATELRRVPGVSPAPDGVLGMRFARLGYEGRAVALKAFDRAAAQGGRCPFEVIDRGCASAARELLESRAPTVMVSDSFARQLRVRTGQALLLQSPTGPLRARVVAQVIDFASAEGVIYIARDLYRARWRDPLVTAFGVRVAPGTDVRAVRRAIEARLGARGVVTTLPGEARAALREALDESLIYNHAITLAALLVGLLGLLNAALTGLLQRTRELAALRAAGLSRRQLALVLLGESGLLGLLAGSVGVLLGLLVARSWLVGALGAALGFAVPVAVPWSAAGVGLGAALGVGGLVGVLAAARAGRLRIVEALRV